MKFIYPIDFDATMAEGTCDGTTFSVSDSFTDDYRLNDGAIDAGTSLMTSGDAVRFDFGSAVTPDAIALYIGTGSASAASIYGSANGTSSLVLEKTITASSFNTTGWFVSEFSGSSYRYHIVRFTGTCSGLSVNELFIASIFDFPYRFDLGRTELLQFGVDIVTGQGGGEFTNKNHSAKTLNNWNWRTFSETNKTNFKTMITAVDGIRTKFLWYDDSTYNWVRFQSVPSFTEQTYQAYGVDTGLRSQLT